MAAVATEDLFLSTFSSTFISKQTRSEALITVWFLKFPKGVSSPLKMSFDSEESAAQKEEADTVELSHSERPMELVVSPAAWGEMAR